MITRRHLTVLGPEDRMPAPDTTGDTGAEMADEMASMAAAHEASTVSSSWGQADDVAAGTGQRVLYLHGLAALAVPLTPAVVAWLADELARVR